MKTLLRLLALLPLPLAHLLGAAVGRLFSVLPNRHRRISARNIELCFPEVGTAGRRRLLRASLVETGKTLFETPFMWFASRRRILGSIREIKGEEHLHEALAKGQGVILAAPHLGCWELIGHYIAAGEPMASITCLYKPPRNPSLESAMRQGRMHLGVGLAPTDASGVKSLLGRLKRGEVAGILPDQDPMAGNGVFAPFFGIATNTMTLLTRLASKSGAAVLVSWAERLPGGRGYRLHFSPCPDEVNERDALTAVSALNSAVEAAVRECPQQYQWSYKRFRTRPEGESGLY